MRNLQPRATVGAVTRQSPWPGDGLPLSAFRGRDDGSVAAFEAAYGRGFLVLVGLKLKRGSTRATVDDGESTDPGRNAPSGGFTVFPVQKRPDAPFDFVSVGRAPGNDIIIGDASVSKFHAYLRETEEGFVLQDGGSRNGTTRNDVPVAARGHGKPVVLAPGDRVKFGAVTLTFMRAEGLLELVRGTAHTTW